MDITRWSLDKSRITIVSLFIVVLGGFWAYFTLPRAEDPGFTIRIALVQTLFPGASPERIELLVTDKLEKAIQQMPELDRVTSESRTGVSIIKVKVKDRYKNLRPIWDSLRRKIQAVRSELPDDIIGPLINDEFGDVFGVVLTISGKDFSYAELKKISDEVRDELLFVDEVAKVEIYGAQEERVFVEFNETKIAELGVSLFYLKDLLESQNIIIPGGSLSVGNERIVLEPTGNFESIEALKRTVVKVPGRAGIFHLGDFVSIQRDYVQPPQTLLHANGLRSLGLAVSLREGGNIIRLGEAVQKKVAQFRSTYPIGVDFDLIAFQPKDVNSKVNDFVWNLIQSIAIVLLVMLVFLGLRMGLLVSSLIPTAMLMSLLFMAFLDIGLDQVSLASLIIALGMLVDNAIVMTESIMVQVRNGSSVREAALRSAKELKVPLLTSSLTTSAAFLPIFLAESDTGEYTAPLFKVVTLTLLCSWLLAITMIPLFCTWFLKIQKVKEEGKFSKAICTSYKKYLLMGLQRPWLTTAAIVGLFVVSLFGFKLIPNIFFPPSDKTILTVNLNLPMGTRVERTEEVVAEIEKFVNRKLKVGEQRQEGVTRWAFFIGEGAPRFVGSYSPKVSSPEYAFGLVNVSSVSALGSVAKELEKFAWAQFPELEMIAKPLELGPPVDSPIGIRILGKDYKKLAEASAQVEALLADTPGAREVSNDWGVKTKKLVVQINQTRAIRAGVSSRDVAIALQTTLSGFEATDYREGDQLIPIVIRSDSADQTRIEKLQAIRIVSASGGRSVPLGQIADIVVQWQPSKILRRNRLKAITVKAELKDGYTADQVNALLLPKLHAMNWTGGTRFEMGGASEESKKAEASIAAKLPFAALMILLLLVGQFNSLRRPAIILLTIPMGIIGVVFGLIVTGSYFGFMTLLGIISLSGIVINNAIVLLDTIKLEIEENGLSPQDAILEGCQRRLRPILLTTLTTVGGLLPLWLGGGLMWEPMAIAIIFGLLFATVLTLGVVPVLYSLFFGVRFSLIPLEKT